MFYLKGKLSKQHSQWLISSIANCISALCKYISSKEEINLDVYNLKLRYFGHRPL